MRGRRSRAVARGSSTLEILIAFAVLTLSLTAVILVFFSNQSVSVDTQTSSEATYKAEALLEQARAASRNDFTSVISTALTQDVSGAITYSKKLDVMDIDAYTKQATSTVTWTSGGRTLSIILSTLLTNPLAVGGTCNPTLTAAEQNLWKNPQMTPWELVKDLIAPYSQAWSPSNNFIIESIAPYKSHLFLVGGALQGSNPGSFLTVFKIASDPTQQPVYLSDPVSLNPSLAPNDIKNLPQAVAINGNYAYIASGRNFCTTKPDCGQLIVADATNVDTQPLTSADLTYYQIPGLVGSGTNGIGKSLFYADGLIYLGITSPTTGFEFNIIDVGNGIKGGTPTSPKYVGGYPVGFAVSSVYVSNGFAYLATTDNQSTGNALVVLDVSTPISPTLKWTNIFGSSFGYANTIGASADPLYLGFTYNSTNPEFFVLNNPSPSSQPPAKAGPGVSASATNSVNSLIVRGTLAFLVTGSDTNGTGDFEVWDVSSPASPSPWATPLSFDGGGSGTAGGCKGSFIYVGSRPSAADKAHIAVFYPAKQSQTITVTTHAPASAGYQSSFSLAATASSGLNVAITVAGSCSASGNTITMTSSSGNCTVFYNQSGNYNYTAAPQVSEITAATKGSQTITVNTHAPTSAAYGSTFPVAASSDSGLAVAITTTGVCTVSGGTVTMTSSSGNCVVHYNQAGNGNYNAATQVTDTTAATKATSTTVVTCPASVTYSGAAQTPCTVSVTGPGGLSLAPAPTYSNNTSAGTATASYTFAGDANHTGSSDSKNFTINKATPTITWANPVAITYGTALGGTQLNATTGGVAGTFTYTPPAGTVLNAGAGQTLSVHFVPTDSANYNTPADKNVLITVNKATPASVVTTVKPSTSITVGTVVHDEATVTGTGAGGTPTGTVTFTLFKNNNCNGSTLQGPVSGPVNAGLAISPNFTTAAKGSNCYKAVYNGDSNYNSLTASNEALTVN